MPDRLLENYGFNFIVVGQERIVGTPEHVRTYNSSINDMKQTIMGGVQSDWYRTTSKKAAAHFDESAAHYMYKDDIVSTANACSEQMIPKWAGKLRNVEFNMVENCRTMFMHLVILDP